MGIYKLNVYSNIFVLLMKHSSLFTSMRAELHMFAILLSLLNVHNNYNKDLLA